MSRVNPAGVLVEYNGETMQILRQDSLRATIKMALQDFEDIDPSLKDSDARDYRFKRLVGDSEALVGESMFQAERESRTYKVKMVLAGGRRAVIPQANSSAARSAVVENRPRPIPIAILPGATLLGPAASSTSRNSSQSTASAAETTMEQPRRNAAQKSLHQKSLFNSKETGIVRALQAALPPLFKPPPDASRKIGVRPRVTLQVNMPDDKEVPYRVQKTMPMNNLLAAIAAERNEPLETLYLVSGNFTLMDAKRTPEQIGLEDGDLIRIYVGEEGGLFFFIGISLSLMISK